MQKRYSHFCRLTVMGAAISLAGLGGCSHGSDDTGGNSSMGSMSGTTDRQYTQSRANQDGPKGGGTGGNAAGANNAGGR